MERKKDWKCKYCWIVLYWYNACALIEIVYVEKRLNLIGVWLSINHCIIWWWWRFNWRIWIIMLRITSFIWASWSWKATRTWSPITTISIIIAIVIPSIITIVIPSSVVTKITILKTTIVETIAYIKKNTNKYEWFVRYIEVCEITTIVVVEKARTIVISVTNSASIFIIASWTRSWSWIRTMWAPEKYRKIAISKNSIQ